MGFTVVAIALGLVVGLATGGRPANVARRPLQLVSLLMISVALQTAAELLAVPDRVGLSMVLVSYVGLSAFAVANIRLVGMPVVLVGLVCNLAVITVNGGMPVRASSIVASRAATSGELTTLDFGAKRHLSTSADRLTLLGDIVPVRPFREVLSFGDLILALGVADLVFRLLKPVELGRRREPDDGDVGGDEDRELVDTDHLSPAQVTDALVDA
jgi:hypothetical protein